VLSDLKLCHTLGLSRTTSELVMLKRVSRSANATNKTQVTVVDRRDDALADRHERRSAPAPDDWSLTSYTIKNQRGSAVKFDLGAAGWLVIDWMQLCPARREDDCTLSTLMPAAIGSRRPAPLPPPPAW